MCPTAVVTGCVGFIGSHLTDRLLAGGWSVTGVDSFTGFYPRVAMEANVAGACAHASFALQDVDIVDGRVAAGEAPGGLVTNLGGGHRIPLAAAVELLGRITGRVPRLWVQGTEAGDVRDTWADITTARGALGYEPRRSLREGVRDKLDWIGGTA